MLLTREKNFRHLSLPATLACKFPPKLRLEFGTALESGPFQLLAIPVTHFFVLIAACETLSAGQVKKYVDSLFGGLATDSVPIFLAEGDDFRSAGRIDVLSALQQLGHTLLPVLATSEAAAALKEQAAAQTMPSNWLLE